MATIQTTARKEMRFKDELQRYLYYVSQIDYCYWVIKEVSKHTGKMESPLEAMIDKATGFDKELVIKQIDEIKYLSSVIIRCKKKLGYDVDNDKKFLKELKKLK